MSHSDRGLLLRAAKNVVVGASDGSGSSLHGGRGIGRSRGLVGDVTEGNGGGARLSLDGLGRIVSAAEADRGLAAGGSIEAGGGALNDEVLGSLGYDRRR